MDRSADNISQVINGMQRDLEELKTTQLRGENIPDGAITTQKLANGAVTPAKVAPEIAIFRRTTLYDNPTGTVADTTFDLSGGVTGDFDELEITFLNAANERRIQRFDSSSSEYSVYMATNSNGLATDLWIQLGTFQPNAAGSSITRKGNFFRNNMGGWNTGQDAITIIKIVGINWLNG